MNREDFKSQDDTYSSHFGQFHNVCRMCLSDGILHHNYTTRFILATIDEKLLFSHTAATFIHYVCNKKHADFSFTLISHCARGCGESVRSQNLDVKATARK